MGKTTQRSSPTPRHRPHTPFTWPGQQACEGPSEVSVTRLVAVTGRMEDPGPRPSPRALSTESLFKSQDRETGSNPNPNPILLLLNHLLHSGHDPWGEKSASPLTLSSFHPLPLCQPLWEERLWHFQGPYPRHPIQPHYPKCLRTKSHPTLGTWAFLLCSKRGLPGCQPITLLSATVTFILATVP